MYVCVWAASHSICSYACVFYGHRMGAAHFTNVGRPCSGSSVYGVVADGKQLSFLRLCVSVWCGQRLKSALVHMGTNDRIWFSEPICKKMKETKPVRH